MGVIFGFQLTKVILKVNGECRNDENRNVEVLFQIDIRDYVVNYNQSRSGKG